MPSIPVALDALSQESRKPQFKGGFVCVVCFGVWFLVLFCPLEREEHSLNTGCFLFLFLAAWLNGIESS